MIGLDQVGNPVSPSMEDKQMNNDILPVYELKPENLSVRDRKMTSQIKTMEHRNKLYYSLIYIC